jgi:superfamily II DNA or RNA helicase
MSTDYATFLASKRPVARPTGFDPVGEINPKLFPWQALIVEWALKQGRAAIWADCGLGKSGMQLTWADHVCRHTGVDVLILTPLAVARQMKREAEKFGVEATVCRTGSDVRPGINITNYQMLLHFDPKRFSGVVVDEADILANFTGKTKQAILAAFHDTPYKLDCSATPAPNDHLELGNHADFLDVMESHEMISRWFINDTMEAGNYRLKRHAEADFWRWVSSWAVGLSKPSDLGYEDGRFALPPLDIREHVVAVDLTVGRDPDMLFRVPEMSATSMHAEMRLTAESRASAVAELVRAGGFSRERPWLVWVNTDYEAEAVRAVLPEAVEVRGSEPIDAKEEKVEAFSLGQVPLLISKPSICGHGLNWQHCRDMAYVGLSYSFKQLYQSIRRCWRYGQQHPVTAHMVMAETEGRVLDTIRRKQRDHEAMKAAMVGAMRRHGLGGRDRRERDGYDPRVPMELPTWLSRERVAS